MKLQKFAEEKLLAERLKTPGAVESYEKMSIGAQIKHLRERLRIPQKTFASKLHTSQSAVARMEAGQQNFSIGTLIKISFILGKKLTVRFH
jgi:DNA-binding transcriptional regulator YiaG